MGALTSLFAAAVSFLQAGIGAIARSVQSKERDLVSVADFGAKCDRSTDDTAAVQAAIDYCLSLTTPLVNGQSQVPVLIVPGMCLISASLIIDRPANQTSQFIIRGVGGGFLTLNAIPIISTTYVNPVLSNQLTLESLTFSGNAGVVSYALDIGNFVRTKILDCFFQNLRLGKTAAYIQSLYIRDSFFRGCPGKVIDTANAFDVSLCGNLFESLTDTAFYASGTIDGARVMDNLAENNGARFIDATNISGSIVAGNYSEANVGQFVNIANIARGLRITGNYIQTRAAAPNNAADPTYYEIVLTESNGVVSDGNWNDARLYKFAGTNKFAQIGDGDYAAITLYNVQPTSQHFGSQVFNSVGLQETIGSNGNRFMVQDFRTEAAGTTPFLKFNIGAGNIAAFIRVVCAGNAPGNDEIAAYYEWAVFRRSGSGTAMTITSLHSAGVGAGAITCTQSVDDIVLNYVFIGVGANTFNTTVEFLGSSATPTAANPITATIQ